MSDPFIGEIKLVGFNFAPRGFAFCRGQLLPIAQNTALFSLLGTQYGGDGRTTFGLPDLQGRAPIGFGSGPGLPSYPALGIKAGAATTHITNNNLPAHQHSLTLNTQTQASISIPAEAAEGDSSTPGTDKILAQSSKGLSSINTYTSAAANTTLKPFDASLTIPISGETNATGSSQAINIQSPALTINYVIALTGLFPSRS